MFRENQQVHASMAVIGKTSILQQQLTLRGWGAERVTNITLCPAYYLTPGVPKVVTLCKKGLDCLLYSTSPSAKAVTWRQRKNTPASWGWSHVLYTKEPSLLARWRPSQAQALYFWETRFLTKSLRTLLPSISTQFYFTPWKPLPFTLAMTVVGLGSWRGKLVKSTVEQTWGVQ